MAIKVTTTGQTTFVKKVVVGIPIRNVSQTLSLNSIDEINIADQRHKDLLVYDSDQQQYISSFLSAPGFNITYSGDSDKLLLSLVEINGGTF